MTRERWREERQREEKEADNKREGKSDRYGERVCMFGDEIERWSKKKTHRYKYILYSIT